MIVVIPTTSTGESGKSIVGDELKPALKWSSVTAEVAETDSALWGLAIWARVRVTYADRVTLRET